MKATMITGASSGIGEAFAKRLAGENHNLLLIARSETKLKVLCEELRQLYKIEAQYIAIDLSHPGADEQVLKETQRRNLSVDWLINNAGIGSAGDFVKLDLQREFNIIQLNIATLVGLTQRYLKIMRADNNGTIINIGSVACFTPTPFQATYAATKAFVSFIYRSAYRRKPYL
ncbi:SDR family NAD(P)-dependent oxidoreductase [Pedobacter frigidisoli]|uniref:SDR family NAD(P)-dependent oxidoreductase n=1 Tax=Pedobacter frigidisoli TaxID=2530455 RepID=A0A4R0NE24_9SPHI|nr:SDR family NAD(P)-dependent oxidoreductase [Pedobacter frigidisoli]TCC97957.1 SDR family NAD(P)-dependent oxidoreductase [Pedobacter frigidisoli]